MPGRMHDARVFRNSALFHNIANEERPLIPENMHLIGDSAYPLLKNLMTPIRDNGHLRHSEISYNTKLSYIRSIIERTFGILKMKFRRFKYLDIADFNFGNNIIATSCILHNFIIIHDALNIEDDDNYFYDEREIENGEVHEDNVREEYFQAVEKRRQIVELF